MNLFEKLNRLDDSLVESKRGVKKKKLTESVDKVTWSKLKQFADNPETTGLDFAYSGPYADEVAVLYGETIEEYNQDSDITIEPSASVQAGRGASELYSDDGGYASIDFETECDELLEFAREADSVEEFKQLLLGHIYSFVELLEYEEDVYDDDIDEMLTESNDSYNFLKQIREATKSYARITASEHGIRLVSLEDDLASYINRDKFNKYVEDCLNNNMSIDDIIDDIPWDKTISVHHAFEAAEYNEDKRRLNREYGFTKERIKSSRIQNTIPKLTFTELKKQNAEIVPYVKQCVTLLEPFTYTKSVKVLSRDSCIVIVTVFGNSDVQYIEHTIQPLVKQFPGEIDVTWGRDCPDWRLSRFNIKMKLTEESSSDYNDYDEMLTESTEKTKIEVKFEPYTRYGYEPIKTARVSGKDLFDALLKMTDKMRLYINSDYAAEYEEDYGVKLTAEALLEKIEEQNGDGCDFIFYIKNLTTGEVLFDSGYEESEDWDDDIDEMLTEKVATLIKSTALTEGSYDPYAPGKYGDLIFEILDSCSGDAIIAFMNEYGWPFYESGDSMSDVYDKINNYLDTHSGYGLWSDLNKYFD